MIYPDKCRYCNSKIKISNCGKSLSCSSYNCEFYTSYKDDCLYFWYKYSFFRKKIFKIESRNFPIYTKPITILYKLPAIYESKQEIISIKEFMEPPISNYELNKLINNLLKLSVY